MKQRILIVEDEPGIADTLQYALRTEGFEPVWVATGEAALEQVQSQAPARACWGSTTTPASATCRSKVSCPPDRI